METSKAKGKPQTFRSPDKAGDRDHRRATGQRSQGRNSVGHSSTGRTEEGYAVIFEKSRTGYGAYSPDVPGCIAADSTLERTRRLFQSALRAHLALMREYGDRIPKPTTKVGYIAA